MTSPNLPSWSQPDSLDNMAAMGEQDFASFLNLDLGLDFPAYDPEQQQADAHHKLTEALQGQLLHGSNAGQDARQQPQRQAQPHSEASSHGGPMFDFNMPLAFDQNQDMHFPGAGSHSVHSQTMIPPTPNSVEMHGDTVRYLQHLEAQNRALLEQQYRLKSANTSTFTPLVSPAVPADDGRFSITADYTVPGAYFSPLTSPALEGQMYPYHANNSGSSIAASAAVDPDIDMGDIGAGNAGATRKTRKRPSNPRSDGANPKIRSSPLSKAQSRRKSALSSVLPSDGSEESAGRNSRDYLLSTLTTESQHPHGSSTESISPEPLSEAIMGPPQKPASAMQSPAISAKSQSPRLGGRSAGQRPSVATPASLMRIPQTRSSRDSPLELAQRYGGAAASSYLQENVLDDLTLPESATTTLYSSTRSDDEASSPEGTPKFSARKTPKIGPLSTPSGSAPASASIQPRMTPNSTALNSLSTTSVTSAARKSDSRSRNKKRGSISSSVLVSPALRPKISPQIKPMVSEGVSDDAHTIFLASRSNYQNLIEGTHVPGVSYPTELSTNLTSKRTSHKIAEQGRRNRINVALQEMLSLLPKSSPLILARDGSSSNGDGEAGGDGGLRKGDLGGKNSGNSKAATVESAIDYIRALQEETEEKSKAVEERNRECESLKKKLKELEKLLGQKGLTEKGGSNSSSGD